MCEAGLEVDRGWTGIEGRTPANGLEAITVHEGAGGHLILRVQLHARAAVAALGPAAGEGCHDADGQPLHVPRPAQQPDHLIAAHVGMQIHQQHHLCPPPDVSCPAPLHSWTEDCTHAVRMLSQR